MRPALGLALFACACANESGDGLGVATHCEADADCGPDASCRAGSCIADGSLKIGGTCTQERQCGLGLVCHGFVCKTGCTDIYYVDDCAAGLWCEPIPDAAIQISETEQVPVGECVASQCDPAREVRCADGGACVAITETVGACLPYCEYGFEGSTYVDACVDTPGTDFSCAPLGLTSVPVCLPADPDDPPVVGVPGCDAVRAPCAPGAICIDIVCRQLCSRGQLEPCPGGQSCTPLGERSDVFFCRAD